MSYPEFENPHVFIIETDNQNPTSAIERGKAIAGIRGQVEFTLEQIGDKRWKVTFTADRYCNFRRIFNGSSGVKVVEDDKL